MHEFSAPTVLDWRWCVRDSLTIRGRISLLAWLFLVVACICSLAALFVATFVGLTVPASVSMSVGKAHQLTSALLFFAGTIASWYLVKNWQLRIDGDKRLPWFLRLRTGTIWTILLSSAIVLALIPMPILETDSADQDSFFVQILVSKLAALILLPMIWFWWCEKIADRGRSLFAVALSWVLLSVFPWSEWHLAYFDLAPKINEMDSLLIGSWIIGGETRKLSLALRPFDVMPGQWVTSLLVSVFLCFVSFAIYRLGRSSLNHPIGGVSDEAVDEQRAERDEVAD